MGWAKALYIDSLYADAARDAHAQEEQEQQRAGMAVNSGSLMLKRCRQAQKMHGDDPPIDAPADAVRMDKKVRTAVQNGFCSGARSSGLGPSDDGNDSPSREGQENNTGADGQSEK